MQMGVQQSSASSYAPNQISHTTAPPFTCQKCGPNYSHNTGGHLEYGRCHRRGHKTEECKGKYSPVPMVRMNPPATSPQELNPNRIGAMMNMGPTIRATRLVRRLLQK
ncbi:hypothetical protein BC939DRAFT_452710 [Gamsiella multidivaricata]|uniref:uncharacterized protein n=1 Tax=Gamsiella multidivaricata TaxID=101098 RepID=UPI002220E823|nr:uncharacterized protein BC939DRAFT_452710 [Gamsiella multidivaricata]KAI7823066.1 hypothetical protein BC939DRAFT_452710 [Gamsiella multidivaricata]